MRKRLFKKVPYSVLPSVLFCPAKHSEASLTSFGTASLLTSFGTTSSRKPLVLRLGATKRGSDGQPIRHPSARFPLCLPESRKCRGTPPSQRSELYFPPCHKENFSQKETLFTLAKPSFSEWEQSKPLNFLV